MCIPNYDPQILTEAHSVTTALSALTAATLAMSAAAEAVTASVLAALAPSPGTALFFLNHLPALIKNLLIVPAAVAVPAPIVCDPGAEDDAPVDVSKTAAANDHPPAPAHDGAASAEGGDASAAAAATTPSSPLIKMTGPWRAGFLYGVVPSQDLEAVADHGEKWFAITRGHYVGLTKNSAISLHAVIGVSSGLSERLNSQAEALEHFNAARQLNAVRVIACRFTSLLLRCTHTLIFFRSATVSGLGRVEYTTSDHRPFFPIRSTHTHCLNKTLIKNDIFVGAEEATIRQYIRRYIKGYIHMIGTFPQLLSFRLQVLDVRLELLICISSRKSHREFHPDPPPERVEILSVLLAF